MVDIEIGEGALRAIAALTMPHDNFVTSKSAIKIGTVQEVLGIVRPDEELTVTGDPAPSEVGEQPIGNITIAGALNRQLNSWRRHERIAPNQASRVGRFSVENGIFRRRQQNSAPATITLPNEHVLPFTTDADLSTVFDPAADYEDRAVAVVSLPGYPTVVQVSPAAEAVLFPREAVRAAFDAEGGFDQHTVGSKLVAMGLVQDKQNPHAELTANRPGGALHRQDQMARVLLRALLELTQIEQPG